MIEAQLARCVASFYPGATGVAGAARLSGGASQETWTFDILHPGGTIGAILRRQPRVMRQLHQRGFGIEGDACAQARGRTRHRIHHDAG